MCSAHGEQEELTFDKRRDSQETSQPDLSADPSRFETFGDGKAETPGITMTRHTLSQIRLSAASQYFND